MNSKTYWPVQTRFLHRPFLKSWNTRFLYSCNIPTHAFIFHWTVTNNMLLLTVNMTDCCQSWQGNFSSNGLKWCNNRHALKNYLHHFCMYVKTRVAQLCNLLSQKFHPLGWVTEYYRLVDLELNESIRIEEYKITNLHNSRYSKGLQCSHV